MTVSTVDYANNSLNTHFASLHSAILNMFSEEERKALEAMDFQPNA